MNKVLLALFFVCVISVSVQAFVKRDAPVTADSNHELEDIMKQITELGKAASEKLKDSFNPDQLNEGIQKISKQIQEGINKLSSSNKESVAGAV